MDLQQTPSCSITSLLHLHSPPPIHLHSPPLIHLHSISDPSLIVLYLSLLSPYFTLCPCLPVSLISVPMLPWSSHLLHIETYPVPSSPCFTLVPLFLVPDWVKLNLQCCEGNQCFPCVWTILCCVKGLQSRLEVLTPCLTLFLHLGTPVAYVIQFWLQWLQKPFPYQSQMQYEWCTTLQHGNST